MKIKRLVSLVLALAMFVSVCYGEGQQQEQNFFQGIGNWFSQAYEDSAAWVSQAWEDSTGWVSQAWKDSGDWIVQAWNDSGKWISKAWGDSTTWVASNWSNFVTWIDTITTEDPYKWINVTILNNGIYAYDAFIALRTFMRTNPDISQLEAYAREQMTELSLLEQDQDILMKALYDWSTEKNLAPEKVLTISMPFLLKLVIEGEAAIGEGTVFSGPVVAQCLITTLESLNLSTTEMVAARVNVMNTELEQLIRPIVIGDRDQNVLVTDEGVYIENFTYLDSKYKIILLAGKPEEEGKLNYPLIMGQTLEQLTKQHFADLETWQPVATPFFDNHPTQCIEFTTTVGEQAITGRALGIWSEVEMCIFFVTEQEWNENDFNTWHDSIQLASEKEVTFAVDLVSDGSFFGINQSAQRYTINRLFDEARFTVPFTGHGWAAERGNNLIDNIKLFVKGAHSTIVGDNYVKNGPDRKVEYSDGTIFFIQSKYCSTASRSIGSCFENGLFRYVDAEGQPMMIEVPSDQYEAAVEYMKNRIQDNQVKNVEPASDEEALRKQAEGIVKKGHLTYQQAKNLAKAGTIESIAYDSAHACVTAATAMGLSAAVEFAMDLWNGETVQTAINDSIYQGLKTFGTTFAVSVLSAQIAKTGINKALIPASQTLVKAMGPKAAARLINAFRPAGSQIYGAAAMRSAAKLLRTNVITMAVTAAIMSVDDVADIIQGKISFKQLAKNVTSEGISIIASYAAYTGACALAGGGVPGAIVGILVATAGGMAAQKGADFVLDLIAEDDADEMIRIIGEQFSQIAPDYFLTEEEVDNAIENLNKILSQDMLQKMFRFPDHEAFGRQLAAIAIDEVVANRPYIELPDDEEYSEYVVDVLKAIDEDLENNPEE